MGEFVKFQVDCLTSLRILFLGVKASWRECALLRPIHALQVSPDSREYKSPSNRDFRNKGPLLRTWYLCDQHFDSIPTVLEYHCDICRCVL